MKNEKGFTLIEILAALGIFSILMSFTVTGFMNNLRSNMNMQIRYEAVQAAQNVIDELRVEDIATMTVPQHHTVTEGTRTYNVDVAFCTIPAFCVSNDIRHIAVTVTYKTQTVYATDTVFSKL